MGEERDEPVLCDDFASGGVQGLPSPDGLPDRRAGGPVLAFL